VPGRARRHHQELPAADAELDARGVVLGVEPGQQGLLQGVGRPGTLIRRSTSAADR
jgi:hypothetical protein